MRVYPKGESRTDVKDGTLTHVYLTNREKEVLDMTGFGMTSLEIATILGIARRTVDFYLANVYRKLDVNN